MESQIYLIPIRSHSSPILLLLRLSRTQKSKFPCLLMIACNHLPGIDWRGARRDNVFVERLWRKIKYEEVYLDAYNTVPLLARQSENTRSSSIRNSFIHRLKDIHPVKLTSMQSRQYRWHRKKGRHLLSKPVATVKQTDPLLSTNRHTYTWPRWSSLKHCRRRTTRLLKWRTYRQIKVSKILEKPERMKSIVKVAL